MLCNAGISSTILLLLLLPPPVLSGKTDDDPTSVPGHYVVKLHKQRVPVKGQAEAVSYKNVYFGTVYIGSPAKQEFSVVFDTGSGHVVVPSMSCKSPTCRIHRRYSRKQSAHAVDVDFDGTPVKPGSPRDQITVAYGTGEVTGQFVNDRLCLSDSHAAETAEVDSPAAGADANASLIIGEDQVKSAIDSHGCLRLRVVTATDMTHDPFHSFSFDGVLGLGLEALTLAPEFSFFGQMAEQGKVAPPTFGVFLADHEDEQSEICFGGHQTERLKSELLWSPVSLPELGYWQVAITGVRVGNRSLDFCDDGQCRAVVDTGTSLLAVPHDFADELESALLSNLHDPPSNSGLGTDCMHANGDLLHFDIEGLTVSLTAGDYARPAVMLDASEGQEGEVVGEGLDTQADIDRKLAEESKCQPTIMPIDMAAPIGPKLFIWGEPVLRRYYTVYDAAEKRIGFGLAAHTRIAPVEPASIPRSALLAV